MGQNNANPSAQPPSIMDFLRSISDPARTQMPASASPQLGFGGGARAPGPTTPPYTPVGTPMSPVFGSGVTGANNGPSGVPFGFNGAAVGAQRGSQIGMARAAPITGPMNAGNSSNPASSAGGDPTIAAALGAPWQPRSM